MAILRNRTDALKDHRRCRGISLFGVLLEVPYLLSDSSSVSGSQGSSLEQLISVSESVWVKV